MLVSKKECVGCGNCSLVCKHGAITFNKDSEGFFYPSINESKCVGCNMCEKVCPLLENPNDEKCLSDIAKAYSGYINNEELDSCASGGVSTAISKKFIDDNGWVAGVEFSDDFTFCRYKLTNKKEEIESFKGSKYIQVRNEKIFYLIREKLINNEKVLFFGTPCNIKALLKIVNKLDWRENLFIVELICHGPTSELLLEKFIKEKRIDKISKINFKNKHNGWENPSLQIIHSDGEYLEPLYNSEFGYGFLNFTRLSCYNCYFKDKKRESDLIVGDYWGIDKNNISFNDHGVSAIIVNSSKGKKLIENLTDFIIFESSIDNISKGNYNLFQKRKKPLLRIIYSKKLRKKGIKLAYIKSEKGFYSIYTKVKKTIKKILGR